ncbi:sugar ABC transporter substrate-binding protein [Microbacterium sp. ARD32]|uniref:ABC transporter substrate-binding protein n=1 Tax=Microbacterium sp. ARD32 TaxID=2962577 RepID=UPI00288138F1|nr:sugar ABC transporter substrate-binding protein [Microbacterium sp. ARD32]MDT0157121.1 sugar ABC transporter substrate-binding protein [Microbacterium sp. ARD32]
MRKLILAAGTVLVAGAMLVGCSAAQTDGSPGTSNGPADQDTKAELTYAVWDQNQVAAIKANLEGFNESYPNISVNVDVTPYGDYWTKLQTQASSDTLPDLFWMNGPNFQLYASNDKLEPIRSQVKSGEIDPANYPESLVKMYSFDGVQYGVPKDFDTIGVWVNKALFARAGVDLPEPGWSWDDFQRIGAEISQKLKADGDYGAAAGMDGQTTYYNTILQAGGEVITADGTKSGYDSAAAAAGIQFWTDLIDSGASPTMAQLTETTADQWFLSGKLAMYQGGDWFRAALVGTDLEKDVVAVPLPKGKVQATVIHGVSNVVAAGSRNKAAAQALQSYLAGKQAQQQQGDLGAIIPAFHDTQQGFVASMPDADLQIFLDELEYAQPLPISKNTAAWNALETKHLGDAFSGSAPVATVLKELASQMDEALAKE